MTRKKKWSKSLTTIRCKHCDEVFQGRHGIKMVNEWHKHLELKHSDVD